MTKGYFCIVSIQIGEGKRGHPLVAAWRSLGGGMPTRVTAGHGPTIEPCRHDGKKPQNTRQTFLRTF
jgi:hypothetical protein